MVRKIAGFWLTVNFHTHKKKSRCLKSILDEVLIMVISGTRPHVYFDFKATSEWSFCILIHHYHTETCLVPCWMVFIGHLPC